MTGPALPRHLPFSVPVSAGSGLSGQGISLTAVTMSALAATARPTRRQVRRFSVSAIRSSKSVLSVARAVSISGRVTGSPASAATRVYEAMTLASLGSAPAFLIASAAASVSKDEATAASCIAAPVRVKAVSEFRQGMALLSLSLLAALVTFGEAMAQGPAPLPANPPPIFGAPRSPAPGAADRPETPAPSGAGDFIEPSPAAVAGAAPPAAGETGRQAGGAAAAAAGVPGRRDDPPPAAPASPSEAPDWFWRTAEIAQAFECPIGPLAGMLEAAQGESEFSPALELEREVLVLCRDRWGVLKGMMDSELALAAVLRADRSVREREALELETVRRETEARAQAAREQLAIAVEERRRVAQARIEGARRGAREGAREAAREAEARKLAKAAAAEPAPKAGPAVVAAPEPAPEERYGWFAMKGSGTDLRAGVTDGEGRWWVRVGDALPGGVRIGAIRSRPPRVVVAGGAAAGLPYRAAGR